MRFGGLVAASLFLTSVGGARAFLAPRELDSRSPGISHQEDLLTYQSHPFSGILVERFPDGGRYKETHYLNGFKDGSEKQYALNGRVVREGNFIHGKREGLETAWFSEGPKKFEYHFKNGVLDGSQTQWHISGALFRQELYKDGTLIDKKILYPQGEVFTNYVTRDDRKYGLDGGSLCMEPKREGAK
jgi:hypothetical protein